jgi:hypothetical protein
VIGAIVRPPLWASGRDSLGVMQILEDGKFQPAVAEPRPVGGARRLATWPGAKNDMRVVAWRCGQVMRWRGDGGEETEFAISRPWERGGSIVHRASGIVHRASCLTIAYWMEMGRFFWPLTLDPTMHPDVDRGGLRFARIPAPYFTGSGRLHGGAAHWAHPAPQGVGHVHACSVNACRVRAERVFRIRQT